MRGYEETLEDLRENGFDSRNIETAELSKGKFADRSLRLLVIQSEGPGTDLIDCQAVRMY